MNHLNYPQEVLELIEAFKLLPGIGSRGAERMAQWMLDQGKTKASTIASAIQQSITEISPCPQCGFYSRPDTLCEACSDATRNNQLICVVEQASDVLPIERSGAYNGLYHCLGGKLSPLDDINPEDLNITTLEKRISESPHCEVILATSSDLEGEATATYLSQLLNGLDCQISRLAQGLPAGAGLSHAGTLTLMKAIEGRTKIH